MRVYKNIYIDFPPPMKGTEKRKVREEDPDSKPCLSTSTFDPCDDVIDLNTYRSGLLTCRLRPCSIPRLKLTRYHRLKFECSRRHPDFMGIPEWLKPFLHQHYQKGCRADRLCDIFRELPDDLLSALRTACTTVVVLNLHRMRVATDRANQSLLQNDISSYKMEDEPWLYEGFGLCDAELDTFDQADFGVVR
jgi:hypothetical protein